MEKDERLIPVPKSSDLQIANQDISSTYLPAFDDAGVEDKRSLREYFNVIYKRLPVIVTLTTLITAAVAFYMYRKPSIYSATTTMIIEPRSPAAGQSKDSININFNSDKNYYNTQLSLLQNPDLMREVVINLGMHRQKDLLGNDGLGIFATFKSMFSSSAEASSEKEPSLPILSETSTDETNTEQIILTKDEKELSDSYSGTLLRDLTVEQIERTNLVTITVQSTNPEVAPRVSNMVAELFIKKDINREIQGAQQTLEDLTKSITELKETIEDGQQQLINLQNAEGLAQTSEKGQELTATRLQTLSGQLLEAKDTRRNLEGRYAALQRANAGGEPFALLGENQAVQNMRKQLAEKQAKLEDRIEQLRSQIQELRAKRSNLLSRYTEEYKDVVAINEEIKKREDILAQTERENTAILDQDEKKIKRDVAKEALTGMAAELAASQKRESQLQAAFDAEVASANQKGVAVTKLTTLTRQIETNRQLLDTYIQRQKEQELIISSSKPDNIKISTKAQVPMSPVGPQRNRNIIIALLISLAGGIGLAFLLDYLDDSVRTSDDVSRHLRLPTLALIPHQTNIEKRKLKILPTNGNGAASPSTALSTLEDNRSAMAEAYRHLRTSLLFSSAGNPPKTILVTSSQPSEGKTTTAANTAVTLAQSGDEVVILDCDLRRPRLHNHFGMENTHGVTNYLSGERDLSRIVKSHPHLKNLKVITSGPIPPNPAELLSSNEMKNLLIFLKGNFKHVVIDSPPAISFTDAAILSTLVDGVVLVALAGKSSIHLMKRFKQRLGNIGARIYGVVLNGIKSSSVEYGYYGYGYTYKYYSANDEDETPMMEEHEEVASIHDTNG